MMKTRRFLLSLFPISQPELDSSRMIRSVICLVMFFMILRTIKVYAHEIDDGVMKFTKVLCSTSGKSVKNLNCRVKPVSRNVGFLNFGGKVVKALVNVFVDFLIYHKPLVGGNFVQIVKIDKLEACKIIKMAAENILYRYFLEYANGTVLKGLIRECPYPVGEYKVENATYDVEVIKKWDAFQRFPNGEQRIDIRIFNKADENIISLKIFAYIKIRSNTLNSFDKM